MKSFILSIIITAVLFGSFMRLFDKPKSMLTSVPSWAFIIFVIICLLGYFVSLYWGFTGFRDQRLLNLIGIGLSLFGIACYALVFYMDNAKGEKPGQFNHNFNEVEIHQRNMLDSLLKQTNTKREEVKFVAYWEMNKNPAGFVVCVQKENIVGLQIKNKPLTDLRPIGEMKKLSWLILENCGLTSLKDLSNPLLERLDVSHNKLKSLDGIGHSSEITWLDFSNNPISDSAALKASEHGSIYNVTEK